MPCRKSYHASPSLILTFPGIIVGGCDGSPTPSVVSPRSLIIVLRLIAATAVGERSLAITYLGRLGKSDNICREHLELNVWKLLGISNGTQSSSRKRFEQCKFVRLIRNLLGVENCQQCDQAVDPIFATSVPCPPRDVSFSGSSVEPPTNSVFSPTRRFPVNISYSTQEATRRKPLKRFFEPRCNRFSWFRFHFSSLIISRSSLHVLMQATLISRLNSCTGFRNASFDDRRM